ncbi:MAG: hypothetical protein KatS3mg105_0712 [Gemmatales bacterium]|nr:MAG: hypothetical protein KatS3mg105_0712 [Gemmatales bacterium]
MKAARGPAKAKLRLNRPVVFLVKVDNDAGVTAALRVHGPELRSEMNPRGWLEALVIYGQGKEKRAKPANACNTFFCN